MDKDYTLYGTKIFNSKSKEIGLIICTWKNKFADTVVDYATCVDKNGKRYNIELDLISPMEDCYASQKKTYRRKTRNYLSRIPQEVYKRNPGCL